MPEHSPRLSAVAVTSKLAGPAICFAVTLVVYLSTMAPSISWRNGGIDSGELVTAIQLLGIPHPTGFPVYVLLGRLFLLIPLGEAALRVNAMSALLGASTVAVLAYAGQRLTPAIAGSELSHEVSCPSRAVLAALAGAAEALAFGLSPLFWSRATIAKEYTLHLCLLALMIVCLIEWRFASSSKWLAGFGLFVGLALGNHVTALSILPAAAGFVLMARPRVRLTWRAIVGPGLATLPGLATYAYLPLRAVRRPYLNWDDPSTWSGFVTHLSGAAYRGSLAVGLDVVSATERVLFALRILPQEIGWLGLIAALIGSWLIVQSDRPTAALLGILVGLNLVFAAVYPVRDSEVYLLPVYLGCALTIGPGVVYLALAASKGFADGSRGFNPNPLVVVAAVCVAESALALALNFRAIDASHDTSARDYAVGVLRDLPLGAILVTQNDQQTFSAWYVQQVLGDRPDVVILDERLFGFDWYRTSLGRTYPDLDGSSPNLVRQAVASGRHGARLVVQAPPIAGAAP